jgi:hypothetical protein
MAVATVDFTPGRIISWRKRRFVVIDQTDLDAILAREIGKRKIERIPVDEVKPDRASRRRATSTVNLESVSQQDWRTALKQFTILKPIF